MKPLKRSIVAIAVLVMWAGVGSLLIWDKSKPPHKGGSTPPNTLSVAWIGESLGRHKETYGDEVEVRSDWPDLYPTSYSFVRDGITITLTPFANRIAKIDVSLDSTPNGPLEILLERYSGVAGWMNRPLTDPAVGIQFPTFTSTDERNSFFETNGVVALVQRDIPRHGWLLLWIHASNYPSLLQKYRTGKKDS